MRRLSRRFVLCGIAYRPKPDHGRSRLSVIKDVVEALVGVETTLPRSREKTPRLKREKEGLPLSYRRKKSLRNLLT